MAQFMLLPPGAAQTSESTLPGFGESSSHKSWDDRSCTVNRPSIKACELSIAPVRVRASAFCRKGTGAASIPSSRESLRANSSRLVSSVLTRAVIGGLPERVFRRDRVVSSPYARCQSRIISFGQEYFMLA